MITTTILSSKPNNRTLRTGKSVIQPTLKIGQPDDKYEQEADRVADAVMRMPSQPLQMKTIEDEDELQMKPAINYQADGSAYASPEISNKIDSRKGSGQTIDKSINREMGNHIGADFSNVKIHTDSHAEDFNQNLGSKAFTHGSNIYFNHGEYNPDTKKGKRLLAHELAHVVQQGSSQETTTIQRYTEIIGEPYDRLSDDGKMAVEDHTKNAWTMSSNIAKSNDILKEIHSKVEIKELGVGEITVQAPSNSKAKPKILKKFKITDRATGSEASLIDDCGAACLQILGSEHHGSDDFVAANKRGSTDEFTNKSEYKADDNSPGGLVSTTEKMSGEIYIRIFEREFKKTLSRTDALKEWDKLPAKKREELSKKYGINQFAIPKVGQGITIGSERDMPGASSTGYNFHFGYNLVASGHDYITLEDYDSSGVKYYFDMYGPTSKSQSWAEAPSNVTALDDKTTTMVVQHSESLDGIINTDKIPFANSPEEWAATKKEIGRLALNTKVRIIRKGINWMKVIVNSGKYDTQTGWILNNYFNNT